MIPPPLPLRAALISCLAFVLSAAPAPAQDVPTTQPTKFLRYVDRGASGGELDTADVIYTNGHGITVHLVAAVHIGERAYYQDLAKSFENYDVVLYELIKSKGDAPPSSGASGERSDSIITSVQLLLKRFLNLEFQLDVIDYTKPNFVNADLDRQTFEKMQAARGESVMSLMIQQMMKAWNSPAAGPTPDMQQQMDDLTSILLSPDGQVQLKRLLARQMDDLENVASGLDGPNGSVILTERDKAAIAAFQDALADGKKNIAIFYGAAHMPDLSHRIGRLGFKPIGVQWHMAWDLTVRPNQPTLARQLMDEMFNAIGAN